MDARLLFLHHYPSVLTPEISFFKSRGKTRKLDNIKPLQREFASFNLGPEKGPKFTWDQCIQEGQMQTCYRDHASYHHRV